MSVGYTVGPRGPRGPGVLFGRGLPGVGENGGNARDKDTYLDLNSGWIYGPYNLAENSWPAEPALKLSLEPDVGQTEAQVRTIIASALGDLGVGWTEDQIQELIDAATGGLSAEVVAHTAQLSTQNTRLTTLTAATSKDGLESTLYETLQTWELQPGSDVMATTLNGIGPIAITDENAGGVIGDIAYVVSGYVYNTLPTPEQARALAEMQPTWRGVISRTAPATQGDFFAFAGDPGAYYAPVTTANAESSAGSAQTHVPWLVKDVLGSSYYWPYLERYNLKTKTWLPRVPLPAVVAKNRPVLLTSNVTHAGYWSSNDVHLYALAAADMPPLHRMGSRRTWLVDPTNPAITSLEATEYPPTTPAGISNGVWASSESGGAHLDLHDYPLLTLVVEGPSEPTYEEELAYRAHFLEVAFVSDIRIGSDGRFRSVFPDAYTPDRGAQYASEGGIAGVIDGKLYFGGGDGDNVTGQEFFAFDPVTEHFTRLADFPVDDYPDYVPYGVVGGKLWYFGYGRNVAYSYDPAGPDAWVSHATTGPDLAWDEIGDQVEGFEHGGKLYFTYNGSAYSFDPTTLTSALVAGGGTDGASFLVGDRILVSNEHQHAWFNITSGTWGEAAILGAGPSYYDSEYAGVTYEGVPYILSGTNRANPIGVYGLTGRRADKPLLPREDHAEDAAAIAAALAPYARTTELGSLTTWINTFDSNRSNPSAQWMMSMPHSAAQGNPTHWGPIDLNAPYPLQADTVELNLPPTLFNAGNRVFLTFANFSLNGVPVSLWVQGRITVSRLDGTAWAELDFARSPTDSHTNAMTYYVARNDAPTFYENIPMTITASGGNQVTVRPDGYSINLETTGVWTARAEFRVLPMVFF